MQFGQDLSLQLSPQTHENQSKLPEMTKTALESLLQEAIVSSNLDQIAWTKDGFHSIF